MGRKTLDSLGRPLPKRQNIVLTQQANYSDHEGNMIVAHSLPEALQQVTEGHKVFVIGGEAVFKLALPHAKKLYLTYIDADFPGDTFFPPINPAEWQEISCQRHAADEKNPYPYRFVVLERMSNEER
jgi:dihydrofolate reductase